MDEAPQKVDLVIVDDKTEITKIEELVANSTIEVPENNAVVSSVSVVETVSPVKIEKPIVDLVSVEKTNVPSETPIRDTSITESEPEKMDQCETIPTNESEPERMDQCENIPIKESEPEAREPEKEELETKEPDEVSRPTDLQKDSVDSSPVKVMIQISKHFVLYFKFIIIIF